MPFVRLYIYHENDLFSLIPLFRVTNKIFRCCWCLRFVPIWCNWTLFFAFSLSLSPSLSGVLDMWIFRQRLYPLNDDVFFSPCAGFSFFFIQNHKYFLATRVILAARSLATLLQFTLVRFVYTWQ